MHWPSKADVEDIGWGTKFLVFETLANEQYDHN